MKKTRSKKSSDTVPLNGQSITTQEEAILSQRSYSMITLFCCRIPEKCIFTTGSEPRSSATWTFNCELHFLSFYLPVVNNKHHVIFYTKNTIPFATHDSRWIF